jgi:hypothetical protein
MGSMVRRIRLAVLRRSIQLRSADFAQHRLRIAECFLAAAIVLPLYLAKIGHHPPVGTYIAVMGGLAAVMALVKDPPIKEKAVWILLITLLMVAEIRNLYIADQEQAETFKTIQNGLNDTKKGLDQTVLNLQAVGSSLGKVSDHVDAGVLSSQKAAETSAEAVKTVTGGDSFLVFYIVTENRGGVIVNGKHAVRSAHVSIADAYEAQDTVQSMMNSQPPIEIVVDQILGVYKDVPLAQDLTTNYIYSFPMPAKVHGDEMRLMVQFSALNGLSSEIYIRKRLHPGVWVQAYKVMRGSGSTLVERIDPNFPRGPDGKVQWLIPNGKAPTTKPQ